MLLSFCLPCLEHDHELCFISHPMFDRRIQCNAVFGNVTMNPNWEGWEVWRFIRREDGTYLINSWTHSHRVLCSNPQGHVYTTTNKEGSWERWRITKHPNTRGLLIQSAEHGRYLAFHGRDLYLTDKTTDDQGKRTAWFLEAAHRNQFFISSVGHDKRVSSSGNDKTVFTHTNREPWEKWIIEPTETIGRFTIRSLEHNHHLGSNDEGQICVVGSGEEWAIVASPHGGVFLQSMKRHQKLLGCDQNGCLYLTVAKGGWETWRLEAIMPGTVSEKQIWSWVGIGASTVALSAVMPFAVMGVVGAMGFGSGGIAAGSIGAGMMSAEAIASSGAVAAGGTVATLQSVGAAGLGAAGATAAVGAGATVGGTASAGIAHAFNGLAGHNSEVETRATTDDLPLCAWRQW